MGAAWGRRGRGVGAASGRHGGGVGLRRGGVEAAWGCVESACWRRGGGHGVTAPRREQFGRSGSSQLVSARCYPWRSCPGVGLR